MMDIVSRLRAGEKGLEHQAVSEIEALRAQLQGALKWRSAIDDAYTKRLMPIPDQDAPADVLRRLIQVEVEAAQCQAKPQGTQVDNNGWPDMVLVPREPTSAMIQACLQAALDFMAETKTTEVHPGQTYPSPSENARRCWRAMVKAAGKGEGDE